MNKYVICAERAKENRHGVRSRNEHRASKRHRVMSATFPNRFAANRAAIQEAAHDVTRKKVRD